MTDDQAPTIIPADTTVHLLDRIRDGDEAARDELYRRFLPSLRRWAHCRLPVGARDRLDTDDLVQISLARSLERLKTFEQRREGGFLAYLRSILINALRDEIRRAKRIPRREELDEEAADSAPSPLERALGREALERYEEALAQLPGPDQEAVILRVELGMSYPEIALAAGAPSANAARMRVVRALMRLAEENDANGT